MSLFPNSGNSHRCPGAGARQRQKRIRAHMQPGAHPAVLHDMQAMPHRLDLQPQRGEHIGIAGDVYPFHIPAHVTPGHAGPLILDPCFADWAGGVVVDG